jgi:hypothetical protein
MKALGGASPWKWAKTAIAGNTPNLTGTAFGTQTALRTKGS